MELEQVTTYSADFAISSMRLSGSSQALHLDWKDCVTRVSLLNGRGTFFRKPASSASPYCRDMRSPQLDM